MEYLTIAIWMLAAFLAGVEAGSWWMEKRYGKQFEQATTRLDHALAILEAQKETSHAELE